VPRAVLYCRISESDDVSTSIAGQEADLRERAERDGWTVVEVLKDDGISGAISRAKADRALEMLRLGDADILAVWKADRWSRQGLRAVADLDDVLTERSAARFVAHMDGLDSRDASFDAIFGILAVMARIERKNTRVRVTASIARLRRDGRFAGGNVPFGYRPADNPEGFGRVLVVDEGEAAVVREAAARVLTGESIYSVVRELNARKVPTRRRTTWSIQALRQVLTADTIVGRVRHKGQILRGDDGMPLQVWPPVLDMGTWHQLRGLLGVELPAAQRPMRRRKGRARLLSGIVTCALCRAPLYLRANGAGHAAYGCSAKSNGRPCDGVSISAGVLEEYVTDTFLSMMGDVEVVEQVIQEPSEDLALADVERAINETLAEMGDDDADMAQLGSRLAALKQRRADLTTAPRERVVRLVPTGRTYAEAWEEEDEEQRREMLAATIAILAIHKGKRGRRGLDPSRVLMIFKPPYVADGGDAIKRRWSSVVTVED
jgi:site-specific DNA recombinase